MTKTTAGYNVLVEGMTEAVTVKTVGEVNKLIPTGKRVTKKDIEEGKVEGVTVATDTQEGLQLDEVVEASEGRIQVIHVTDNATTEEDTVTEEDTTDEVEHSDEPVEETTEDTEEDTEEPTEEDTNDEVSDEDFEQPQRKEPVAEPVKGSVESTKVDGKLKDLVAKLKQPEPKADKGSKVKQDLAGEDVEYPERGSYGEDGVDELKKFISRLSNEQLQEWVDIEGLQEKVKENDNPAIYRMRLAMAIREAHYPKSSTSKPKSKSKYGHYTTEQLLEMALDNDVEVKDAKGDNRILRMYTIVALRNAGVIE